MGKLATLLEDFSTAPVPDGRTVGGVRVALIVAGIGIALPAFLMGAQIGTALGLANAVIAIVCGCLLIAAMASMTALVGAEARLSTYMLVQFAFGVGGARLVNLMFAVAMAGWFGVNAAMFGDAMVSTVAHLSGATEGWSLYVALGSLLMVVTTIFGFRALDRLSQLAVPLLLLGLIAVMTLTFARTSPAQLFEAGKSGAMTVGLAMSAVIGGNMVGVASIPDLTRYVSSRRGAVASMFLSYGVAGPLILLSAVIPSLATGEADLMKIFLGLGLGLPALFVLVFSTWTSNAANLYSSGLSLAATFRCVRPLILTLVAGILGTAIALAGIIDVFLGFLIALGAFVPPVASIYVVDFYVVERGRYDVSQLERRPAVRWQAFAAWSVGSLAGVATANDVIVLTTVSACDSFLVSGLCYLVLAKLPLARATLGVQRYPPESSP